MFRKTISELKDTKHEVTVKVDDSTIYTIQKAVRNTGLVLIGAVVTGHAVISLIDQKN